MEGLVREMQDTEHGGVPVRSQKLFLTSIPAAFMGKLICTTIKKNPIELKLKPKALLNIQTQTDCGY